MTHTGRSLSEPALDTLDALHQHRLLTTSQLQEIILPVRSLRRTQLLLGELVQRRLIDWVAASGKWPGPAGRVWFLTKRGGAVVDLAPNKASPGCAWSRPTRLAAAFSPTRWPSTRSASRS